MLALADIIAALTAWAPLSLAEDWDNVGLLAGDPTRSIERAMTCLSITPASAAEAIDGGAQLIVTHHPFPFRPLTRITTESTVGRVLLDLLAHRIAIYSPHTALDSARSGINQRLAAGLGLSGIQPLLPASDPALPGSGRYGSIVPTTNLAALADQTKRLLQIDRVGIVGDVQLSIDRIGVACGSGGTFLAAAHRAGCQTLVTGETNFHTCLEAEALGMGLILAGHFATERFALDVLAADLAAAFPTLTVWPSRHESDPIRWS